VKRRAFLVALAGYSAFTGSGMARDMIIPDDARPLEGLDVEVFRRKGMSDTDLLREAVKSGEANLLIPARLYHLEDTVNLPSGVQLVGRGDTSCLRLERTKGDHAVPLIVAQEGGRDVKLLNFCIDGNGKDLSNPAGDQFAVVSGSAVIVSAQSSLIQNVTVLNGWDNGIAVVHSRTGKGAPGVPSDVRILFNRTQNCGVGFHDPGGPGQIGSGINIGSGGRCIVMGHQDHGSRGAVTVDDGGGASGFALGCMSIESAGDDRVGAGNPTEASRGSGTAFYSGSPDWSFDTCKAYFPRKHGFWLAAAGGMQARGCEVIGAQEHGFYLSGPRHHLSDCRAKNVSQKKDNTYSGYFVDTPFGNADSIIINDCVNDFDAAVERKPRYGYEERAEGRFLPAAMIQGGSLDGKTAGISELAGQTVASMVLVNGKAISLAGR
jgi:hypothetical protein